ncbi:hypothetical protein A5687_00065 [Mycobacterium mantenii]|uniref:PPE family protein n=1 Tax=Mycobacterium mantenii TaxID=560555 RepID=UPI0007FFD891|nr:PPE family protein [Mycobacterium mantenii]OBH54351.1 hypothetical protein A5687_00065 [Mycobacterium mantenii]
MTAPIWMALAPEVHSTLLSSGPGPAGLLASAASWSSLSETYASAADELSATLAAAQAGAWQGPSAERYVAAHLPYLAWLERASANSAATAAQQETAATAYTTALAAMPTLPELAGNHATHAALMATNFFGVNTIPIAVNEADYSRMWVQAATTMSTYQALAGAAVAAAPQTDPAPQIVTSTSSDSGDSDDTGIVDNDGGNPYQLSWWINRFTEIFQTIGRDLAEFQTDPADAISDLFTDVPLLIADEFTHLGEALQAFAPQLLALTFAATAGAGGGFAALTALAAIQPQPVPAPAVAAAPPPQVPSMPAVAGSPTMGAATAPAPASTATTAPVPASASAPAAGAPPPPAGVEGAAFPYLVGGPGIGTGSGMGSGVRRTASELAPSRTAAPTAASVSERQRARRQRRAAMPDHYRGYEFIDLEPGAEPATDGDSSWASERGAGSLGFAGTAPAQTAEAAGLTTLTGDQFGNGPSVPMLPGSWESE